jgi:hypothetical protein
MSPRQRKGAVQGSPSQHSTSCSKQSVAPPVRRPLTEDEQLELDRLIAEQAEDDKRNYVVRPWFEVPTSFHDGPSADFKRSEREGQVWPLSLEHLDTDADLRPARRRIPSLRQERLRGIRYQARPLLRRTCAVDSSG